MRLLVDTHTILWAGLAPARLGKRATAILANKSNEVYVSAASAWEIATKVRLGKLPGAEILERDFIDAVQEAGYTLLSVTAAHALRAGRLPGDHRDPFDRMIAAQALAEDIPVLSTDTKLDSFGITRIWKQKNHRRNALSGRLFDVLAWAHSNQARRTPTMNRKSSLITCLGLFLAACTMLPQASAQTTPAPAPKDYDLLLKGGHVIDAKNNIDAIRDVAIKDGKIAKVAVGIPADSAIKTVNVTGLYVTPGLIDIHTHVFWGLKKNDYADGDWSVAPDGFTLHEGVTTIVDAGSSGWRNFEVFKERVIDRSQTRVLVMLNIVGAGMGSGPIEQNTEDMDGKATGEMALKYPSIIVGVKSAHFTGPEWKPYDQALIAGNMAHIPIMIDYGSRRIERPLYKLLEEKLRPGDIYTHMYMGGRGEQDSETGGPGKGMWEGRQRGIYFDVGHGGASFNYSVAVPLIKAGFLPDSISTDIHSGQRKRWPPRTCSPRATSSWPWAFL